jgi:type IV secretion system protein VirB10
METPEDLTPFMTGEHIDPPERLKAWLLYGVIGAVGFLVVLAIFLGVQSLTAPAAAPVHVMSDTPVMTAAVPPLEPTIKIPVTFAGLDRRPPAPEAPPPPIPRAEKLAEITPPAEEKRPPPPAADKKEEPRKAPEHTGQTTAPQPAQKPEPPKRNNWLFAKVSQQGSVQEPPFPLPKEQEEGGQGRSSKLFPRAQWERPDDPTRVIYRSQVLNGILQNSIDSSNPGLVRILLTEQVEDRFGQGRVLLPQYTVLLGQQDGKVVFGQKRVAIQIEAAELVDGTVLSFQKPTKVGDQLGANAVPGTVDNRWGNVILSAGISALLSIGSRIPAGNQEGFAPTLGQDVSQDLSRSLNQSGQQIVKRELDVSPIITIPYGTPVTIQLGENINLMTPPTLIRK